MPQSPSECITLTFIPEASWYGHRLHDRPSGLAGRPLMRAHHPGVLDVVARARGKETQEGDVTIQTPDQRLRVFVSSSLGALVDERRAVMRAISARRLTPV